MSDKRFWADLSERVGLKKTDKLLIGNIDTSATEYSTIEDVEILHGDYYVHSISDLNSLISAAQVGRWIFPVDIVLTGNKIFPDGVEIVFSGGKISLGNYDITGTNTKIECGLNQLFDYDGTGVLDGTWNVDKIHPEWFGAVGISSVANNQSEIQSAIDFAGDIGGAEVCFSSGFYNVTSGIEIKSNYVTMIGKGRGSIIKAATGDFHVISILGQAIFPDDVQGVRISNLAIWGANTGSFAAVYLKRCHECMVDHLHIGILGFGTGYGIMLDGAGSLDTDNNIISSNSITRTVTTAIRMIGGSACEENIISDNAISYTGLSGVGGYAISCSGQRNSISGNTIEESEEGGIILDGNNNSVTGNTICENKFYGIIIISEGRNTIVGNVCKDNDFDGTGLYPSIYLNNTEGNILSGNVCSKGVSFGIQLDVNANKNIVTGNELIENSLGNISDGGSDNKVYGNNLTISDDSPDLFSYARQALPLTINGASGVALSTGSIKWVVDNDIAVPGNAIGFRLDVQVHDSGSTAADTYLKIKKYSSTDYPTAVRSYPLDDRWFEREVSMIFDKEELASAAVTLTLASSTVTASLVGHGFNTGDTIKIAGADQKRYNGNVIITKINNDSFSYDYQLSPFSAQNQSPATGSITAARIVNNIDLEVKASAAGTFDANIKIIGWILK